MGNSKNSVIYKEDVSKVHDRRFEAEIVARSTAGVTAQHPNSHGRADMIFSMPGSDRCLCISNKSSNYDYGDHSPFKSSQQGGWGAHSKDLKELGKFSSVLFIDAFKPSGSDPWSTQQQLIDGVTKADIPRADRIDLFLARHTWTAKYGESIVYNAHLRAAAVQASSLTAAQLSRPASYPEVLQFSGSNALDLLAQVMDNLVKASCAHKKTKTIDVARGLVSVLCFLRSSCALF